MKYVDEEHDFVEGDIGDVVEEGLEDVDQENNFDILGDFVEEGVDDAEEEIDQTQMKEEGLGDDFVEEDVEEENDQDQLKGFERERYNPELYQLNS